ncbi:CLUMA_CG012808, isoform A [Clunio marinus]|uniref:CLUMA_CG012808, isoform A n=1 Tax=Clunio marinus TaxID=568069 RepID=A0A1J1II92_9DIPT|nr:CLUMA_CG012808, isoform A [Clunio marinus]
MVIIFMDDQVFEACFFFDLTVHGRSDIDSFSITLQLKREEQNLCGQRGLLPGSDHQTYTIIAPKNLRLFYEKLISPLNATDIMTQQHDTNQFNQNFDKMIFTYHNINRFFAAFIDHGLKDVDYIVKEKNLFEKIFNCELYSNINDSKGVFYFDNGHSFDKVLFYGNETTIFSFELFLFAFLVFVSGNYLFSILSIGVITKKSFEFSSSLTAHEFDHSSRD